MYDIIKNYAIKQILPFLAWRGNLKKSKYERRDCNGSLSNINRGYFCYYSHCSPYKRHPKKLDRRKTGDSLLKRAC
jgi:hypothetical protein